VDLPDPREVVVAPVTITPTKPLTPTHVKGLLWTDVLVKATSLVAPTRLVWNPRLAHLTTQTVAFWHHLDRTDPDTDWTAESEAAIGGRYVRFHQGESAERADPRGSAKRTEARALDPYFERIEADGWIHPAARRLLGLWQAEFDLLGVADPGLLDDRPLTWSARQVWSALAERGMLIDHRRFGGPVYLDGARWGMPIRQLAGADGHANYLVPILRELLPMVRPDRVFLLIYDEGLTADYLLLDRLLSEFGARVARLSLSRVAIDGAVRSSRYGGWAGVTLADLSAIRGSADEAAYRLGMRMYFVGVLDRRSRQSFRMDLLRRCVGRAARMGDVRLGEAQLTDARVGDAVSHQWSAPLEHQSGGAPPMTPEGYADPRRLIVQSLGRHPRNPPKAVLG
jgi:hypothetical protein